MRLIEGKGSCTLLALYSLDATIFKYLSDHQLRNKQEYL